MPAAYLKIRNKLKKKGMPMKSAKTQAAKIYNARRKKGQKAVGRYD